MRTLDRITAVALLAACACAPSDVPAPEPKVLLIGLDGIRPDVLAEVETPNLDALAADGFVFDAMFSTSSTTLPAHASLLTGLYPRDLRNGYFVSESVRTLAEILGEHGYTSLAVVSALPLDRRFNLDQGFDVYDSDFSRCAGSIGAAKRQWYVHRFGVFDCDAYETTQRTFGLLEKLDASRPYFLWVHYFDPHFPYRPPAGYYDAAKVRTRNFPFRDPDGNADRASLNELYDGEIRFLDEQIGALRKGLKERGLDDETVTIVVADHGENLYQHDGYLDHSKVVYDTVMQIPAIVRLPGRRGRRVPALSSIADLTPTLLDLIGLPREGFDGRSLVPAMQGAEPDADAPGYVACETNDYGVPDEEQAVAIRTANRKYIKNNWNRGAEEFFDVAGDPGEARSLKTLPDPQAEELREAHADWRDRYKRGTIASKTELDAPTKEALKSLGYLE